ncbi:hypothetical protein Q31b_10260 [Novipirellula aureliae]|uniref:Uncharacterized protein n=1 Tax=Novipirellula aureliae TaxID=2527966 RepID=A0A5C6EAS5_9BACT|nr:hypothetical protein [Novipirellula aureliae]TWU45850.1 hypothetical protein Q31b_10260 [Novipirellula aureliae]
MLKVADAKALRRFKTHWQDALGCVLTSDHMLGERLHRLEGCSAAGSIQRLAKRLRALEETKDRQVANFTRMD